MLSYNQAFIFPSMAVENMNYKVTLTTFSACVCMSVHIVFKMNSTYAYVKGPV